MSERTPQLTSNERKALEALVHYGIGWGDAEGSLTHDESWNVARAVVDQLTQDEVRKTTSMGRFRVEVRLIPEPKP